MGGGGGAGGDLTGDGIILKIQLKYHCGQVKEELINPKAKPPFGSYCCGAVPCIRLID